MTLDYEMWTSDINN